LQKPYRRSCPVWSGPKIKNKKKLLKQNYESCGNFSFLSRIVWRPKVIEGYVYQSLIMLWIHRAVHFELMIVLHHRSDRCLCVGMVMWREQNDLGRGLWQWQHYNLSLSLSLVLFVVVCMGRRYDWWECVDWLACESKCSNNDGEDGDC
jgi:hypothetical protein